MFFCGSPLTAASEDTRQFDIPAGPAQAALAKFAQQSGAQFVYSPSKIRGVNTSAVKGDYTPQQALEIMLSGTPLRAVRDERTGALTLDKAAAESSPGSDSIAPPQLGATSTSAIAQTTSGDRSEGVEKLNPFLVLAAKNNSFQASSAGLGSRLTLDLHDTPIAYSVVNRELIDALGLTDLREAASWTAGQSFVSADNGQDAFGAPQQYLSRGNKINSTDSASNFGNQRNFYQDANLSGDSYSAESFDFGRGPNTAFFGNSNAATGGLGGISSYQSKRPRLDLPFTSISAAFGKWDYYRTTIDINRPISDRIGIRVNAVYDDEKGWRFLEMSKTKGVNLTTTFRLTPTTELRLEASQEKKESHNVGSGWDDIVSGWDGKTVFRGPLLNAMLSTNSAPALLSAGGSTILGVANGLSFNGEPNGIQRISTPDYAYDPYTNTVMNFQNSVYTRRADSTSRVPLWSQTAPNGSYYVRSQAIPGALALQGNGMIQPAFGVGRSFHQKLALPGDIFATAIKNSRFRIPSERFEASINKATFTQRSKDLQLALTQQVSSKLFLEIGGDANRNDNVTYSMDNFNNQGALGQRNGTIDLNQLLPNGEPNRHFLDVVNESPFTINPRRLTDDRTLRVNLAYTDLELGKWGDYTFNLNGSVSTRYSRGSSWILSLKANADPRLWNTPADAVRLRSYWSDQALRAYKEPTEGAMLTDVTWDTANNNPIIQSPRLVKPDWVLTGWSENFFRNRYVLFQTTAKYFDNRLVFTGALRRDFVYGSTHMAKAAGDLPANWNGVSPLYRPDAPADYWTMTFVNKNTATGAVLNDGTPLLAFTRPRTTLAGLAVPNPIFAGDRFRDDYNPPPYASRANTWTLGGIWHATRTISPYFNYSNSFTPPTAAVPDLFGQIRKASTAEGYDFGVNLSLWKDHLAIRAGYFQNSRKNDVFVPTTSALINTLYQANRANDPDTSEFGRNARGATDIPGADYATTRNDGQEIEISGNDLVPGWRIAVNGSQSTHTLVDRGPQTKEYARNFSDLFRFILEDAGGMLDTTHTPAGAPHAPGLAIASPSATGPLVDQTSAVNAYNNLWIQYENLLTLPDTRVVDTPTVNVYTDYQIQSGLLKGLRLGAGLQWQGQFRYATYENQTMLDPNNPIGTAIDDPRVGANDYYYLKGTYRTQANASYSVRLRHGNSLSFNLRIDNPINDRRRVYGEANVVFGSALRQPDGDLTKPNRIPVPDVITRFSQPINYRFTTTYSFGGSSSR